MAAEALRGVGGLLLDANGNRFCNELGTRDYTSGKMAENKAPFYLLLNSKASNKIADHCKHYCLRNTMKSLKSGYEVATEMGINAANLEKTFKEFNYYAENSKKNIIIKY